MYFIIHLYTILICKNKSFIIVGKIISHAVSVAYNRPGIVKFSTGSDKTAPMWSSVTVEPERTTHFK